ncbi:unnamed protein product [Brassica oleracea var. botrytis]
MPPLNSNTPPSLHRIASPKSLTSHNGNSRTMHHFVTPS